METTARVKGLRIAERKVRIVIDTVRGKPVGEAINILTFTRKAAALPVKKLIESAVANARKAGRDVDSLYVSAITADRGPKMRRFMPRALGRAFRVEKRTCHLAVLLGDKK